MPSWEKNPQDSWRVLVTLALWVTTLSSGNRELTGRRHGYYLIQSRVSFPSGALSFTATNTAHTDLLFGSWRNRGRRGGRSTGFGAEHLVWKSSVARWPWTSQTTVAQCSCLWNRKTTSSLNFYASLMKWWIWNSMLNSRAFLQIFS